jgi:hypothetical protein
VHPWDQSWGISSGGLQGFLLLSTCFCLGYKQISTIHILAIHLCRYDSEITGMDASFHLGLLVVSGQDSRLSFWGFWVWSPVRSARLLWWYTETSGSRDRTLARRRLSVPWRQKINSQSSCEKVILLGNILLQ